MSTPDNSADRLQAARDAFEKGGLGAPLETNDISGDNQAVMLPNSFLDEVENNDSSVAPEASPTLTAQEQADIETLFAKDEKGNRQKIDVNYKDKESIKKAFLKAAGMRKFQLERDNEKKERAKIQSEYESLKNNFGELERIYTEGGAKGLFERLGGEGAWEKALEQEMKQREYVSSLSPEDRLKLEYHEKEKKHLAEKSAVEEKYKKMLSHLEEEKESAAVRSLEANLVPAFGKYRFQGKLGDEVAEQEIDEAIWTKVTNKLAQYPDDVALTPSLIEKEFRTVSSVYSKVINTQGNAKATQAVAKQKENATQRVQLATKKGMTANSVEQQVSSDIKNNDWSSLMQKLLFKK